VKKICALFVCLTTAAPLYAGETPKLNLAPYAALVAGQTADAATTAANYRRGFTESNPLFGRNPPLARVLTVKAAETAAIAILMRRLERTGHPRAAKALGYFGGVAGAIPAVINANARR
jgi:hypothetical protein